MCTASKYDSDFALFLSSFSNPLTIKKLFLVNIWRKCKYNSFLPRIIYELTEKIGSLPFSFVICRTLLVINSHVRLIEGKNSAHQLKKEAD